MSTQLNKLNRIAMELDDLASDGELTHEAAVEYCDTEAVEIVDALMAVALCSDLRWPSAPLDLRVCVGNGCLERGSRKLLAELAAKPPASAHVAATTCQNQCQRGPVAVIRTSDGTSIVANATAALIANELT